jgi:hypothetical protein
VRVVCEDEELDAFKAQRAMFGFRADEAYVRELIQRDQWETEMGFIPATPEENAYLANRAELERGPALDRYLAEHPHLDGGTSLEGHWPQKPYLILRVTEDPAEHEERIKALARFPDQLEIVRVAHSMRDLEAIAERISGDDDTLEREGFTVAIVGADVGENAVVVELITARTDADAVFRERYGPVTIEVIATETHSLVPAALTDYRVSGRELIVQYEKSGELVRVDLAEHNDRVEVAVIVRCWNGPTAAVLVHASVSAELRGPLGDRAVIDTAAGGRLRAWRPR